MNLFRGPSGGDHADAGGMLQRKVPKPLPNALVKLVGLPVQSIGLARILPAAAQPDLHRQVEEQRQVRQRIVGDLSMQTQEHRWGKASAIGLIGQCRVDIPIAQDDGAAFERRTNHVRDMLRPSGQHQQDFRPGRHRFICGVQQRLAQRFGEGRPSRLTGSYDVIAFPAEPVGQPG